MEKVRYGEAPSQYVELHLPVRRAGAHPVVVLLHGGFWRAAYGLALLRPLAADLVERGYAVWNVEYRRVGEPGGGWPGTLVDVADAADAVAEASTRYGLDAGRVAIVGHSAGGQLALWLGARHRLPGTAPGASPKVRPQAVVSQAGVLDLPAADDARLGEDAVTAFLDGHTAEVPDRYAMASPSALVPLGLPQLLVHGDADSRVPVTQSREYAAAARSAGDRVELAEFPGVGHFEVIEATHESWITVVDRLPALL